MSSSGVAAVVGAAASLDDEATAFVLSTGPEAAGTGGPRVTRPSIWIEK